MALVIDWHQLNDLESLSYEIAALVDVTQDAILNEMSAHNSESVATVLSIINAKVSEIKDTVEEIYILNREKRQEEAEAEAEESEGTDGEVTFDIPTVWPSSENA